MGVIKVLPDSSLNHSIDAYYIYQFNNQEPVTDIYFPTGKTGIVFHFGDKVSFLKINGHWQEMTNINFVGCVNFPVSLKLVGNTDTIAVVLQPYAIYNLFKISIEPKSQSIDAANFFPASFIHEIFEALNNDLRIKILNQFFAASFKNYQWQKDIFKQICDAAIMKSGLVTRKELAETYSISENYVHKLFVKKIGLSIKPFLQLVRVSFILEEIYRSNNSDSFEIFEKYGYFDQAHFIKDFKRLTGKTPQQYFKYDKTLSAYLSVMV